jgi:4-carboxymuconolactone decarboxylase
MRPILKHIIAMLALTVAGVASAQPDVTVSRAEARPSQPLPAQNFTGKATMVPLFAPASGNRASGGAVTFEPGARTNWHVHPLGQTLIVTAGAGRVQRWGAPAETIRPGDVVVIPANVKHWHGAAPDSAMTHIAVQEAQDGKTVTWMEPVTASQYGN